MAAVTAVIFDWAGTTIDFGSRAPMSAFVKVFQDFDVELSIDEARGPMGLPKLDHIRALGKLDRVRQQWRAAHGSDFDEDAARRIYAVFVPLNASVVSNYAGLVPGTADTVAALREQGIRIGSTTGYTRSIMQPLLPLAAEQGYEPDNLVCAEDLWTGRPTAVMMWKCFLDLQVDDPSCVIKVDDTVAGLAEGIAAGTWTVGVSLSGNEVGLSEEELAALPESQRNALNERARDKLIGAGADYVIDTVAELPAVVERIQERLGRG